MLDDLWECSAFSVARNRGYSSPCISMPYSAAPFGFKYVHCACTCKVCILPIDLVIFVVSLKMFFFQINIK